MSYARTVAVAAATAATSFLAAMLSVPAAHAQLSPAQKCAIAKDKAAAKRAADKIKCYKKTKFATPVDPACLQKAEDKFAKAFAKAEAPDACDIVGDADLVEAQIDTLVTTLVQAFQPTARAIVPSVRCLLRQLQAGMNYSNAVLKCQQQYLSTFDDLHLGDCMCQAKHKLDVVLDALASSSTCDTIDKKTSASTIVAAVETFATAAAEVLAPPTTGTTVAFVSDPTWETGGYDSLGRLVSVGQAQPVCLTRTIPPSCPGGATIYGGSWDSTAWSANLSSIPGAQWVWAPGVTGTTRPADLARFVFRKIIYVPEDGDGGNIVLKGTVAVAADDFAKVEVNGTVVGTVGSVSDSSAALKASHGLKAFNITSLLHSGDNEIRIHAQNGPGSFAGCSGCSYDVNAAGVAFGGFITSIPRFVDNGDGTVFDHKTNLLWEKKDVSGSWHSVGVSPGFRWAGRCGDALANLCQPDAPAASKCGAGFDQSQLLNEGCAQCLLGVSCEFEGFLSIWAWLNWLNSSNFAGHHDWDIPGLTELETILAAPYPCTTCVPRPFNTNCVAECTAATCSCTDTTSGRGYWSANDVGSNPQSAWSLNFASGLKKTLDKHEFGNVRAVRRRILWTCPDAQIRYPIVLLTTATPTPTVTPTSPAGPSPPIAPTPTPTTVPVCGDGIVQGSEQCDPPGDNAQCTASGRCLSDCTCAPPIP